MRGALIAALLLAQAGCVVATTSHFEHAFPERRQWGINWGLGEAARRYDDAWGDEGELVVGPLASVGVSYSPRPNLKFGVESIGSGFAGKAKVVVGEASPWAGAVVGRFGFLAGDDSDPWDNTVTWKASGAYADGSMVLSWGTPRPAPGESDRGKILFTASGGPRASLAVLSYHNLNSGRTWDGNVVDVGGFACLTLERAWFRGSAEISVMSLDRPTAGRRTLRPLGGLQLAFSW